jgi:leucyl aminopeptidase
LDVRLAGTRGTSRPSGFLGVPVPAGDTAAAVALLPPADRAEAAAYLDDIVEHSGAAGTTHTLPRPARRPERWVFAGTGDGAEAGWRAAGAALAKAARKEATLAVALPASVTPSQVGALAEGLWLAAYRFWLGSDDADAAPKLRRVTLSLAASPDSGPDSGSVADPADLEAAIVKARTVAESTMLARDLTNTPSAQKTPAWMARQVEKAAKGITNLTLTVREPSALTEEGFNGILAVGQGSARGPRLVELSWRPRGARHHIVLIGKGITFDTGGICIKTRPGMKLMRKDMGGAAAVLAATVGAAQLRLPVRVTALAPLAENAIGADAYRPGDVVRHYGGMTTEITNTDAEGRVVLADAISYAIRRLRPDLIVDLATLTGGQSVALGKRTAALFSDNDALAAALRDAGDAAGESMWRLPLHDDYVEALGSDVADVVNSTDVGASPIMAALFLREFTGSYRDRWAHIDMSSSAWSDAAEAELVKGATGWGVRTLLRWLETVGRGKVS